MLKKFFVDTESCGLYGVPVLLQYAVDDGPILLVELWDQPVGEFIAWAEDVMENCFICHNINFDHQMIQKWYNMCRIVRDRYGANTTMSELSLEEVIDIEYESRKGKCLKPRAAVDTMILASKGDRQSSLMAAKPIFVRRVPRKYGSMLAEELTRRTDLPWILFGRKKQNKFAEWIVSERENDEGEVDTQFVDVQLKFKPSNSLKDLHQFIFDSEVTKFDEIAPDEFPKQPGYCPYVKPLKKLCKNGWTYVVKKSSGKETIKLWPELIYNHVEFWATDKDARKYAEFDITMLRDLYEHFEAPENDPDAVLACQIAAVRLYGFALDLDNMRAEREKSREFLKNAPINVNSPKQVKEYIAEALDPMEQLMLAHGCNAETLEKIVKEFTLDEKEDCECDDPRFCKRCGGAGVVGPGPMEAARRANVVEEVRKHKKRVELFAKLLLAERAYPNFRAVGTKSGRLSGTDGLNFQGVDKSLVVRNLFILCDAGEVLSGGDYDGQEVAIAGTTMQDDDLLDDMKKGKKIHGLFAAELYETTYDEIMANKEDDPLDRYGKGKSAVFLSIYGGTYHTMALRAGVDVSVAEKAFTAFVAKYPGVGRTKKMISDRFSALDRSDEGKMVYRDPPKKYIESIFGFRRYFNTEFKLQRMIFDLVNDIFDNSYDEKDFKWSSLPGGHDVSEVQSCKLEVKHNHPNNFIKWLQEDETTIIRDTKNFREQKMSAAIASALIGACYSIGNGVIRASNNHLIQSSGRTITVGLQEAIWSLQPVGAHDFVVRPMSVHDEVAAVTGEDKVEDVTQIVVDKLEEQCELIPLLQMTWGRHLKSWGEMKKVKESDEFDWVHAGIQL